MEGIKGKKVIVTGGCKGIGKAIVERFLEQGAIVMATYLSSSDAAKKLTEECNNLEGKLYTCKMDIRDEDDVKSTMESVIKQLDGVDILVNNAGVTKDGLFFLMNSKDWQSVLDTNLNGAFYASKSVIYEMVKQKKGAIINVSSVSGVIGVAGQANYCASKFGLIGLTKTISKEVSSKNIRVNAIAPGYIETDMVDNMSPKALAEVKAKIPMKRMGKTREVANAVVFLASDEASYITGQTLVIDGGLT